MRQADGFWHVQAPADRYVLRHSPANLPVEEDRVIICEPTTHLNCLVPWPYKRPSRQLILFHLSPSSFVFFSYPPISPALILFSPLLSLITFSITAQQLLLVLHVTLFSSYSLSSHHADPRGTLEFI